MNMLLLPTSLLLLTTANAAPQWVPIVEARARYHVTAADLSQSKVYLTVRSASGAPEYLLRCGSFRSTIRDFDFSGDFECQLQSVPPSKRYSTLLTENPQQDRDWESRGRFLADEVAGPCGDIPDFGKRRNFRLRGMHIVLTLSNLTFGNEGKYLRLNTFDFGLEVSPDPSALSTISEPPYLNPRWKKLPCVISHSVRINFR
jgi:hypothetical protein